MELAGVPGASHGARRLLRRDGAEARGARGGDLRPRRAALQHQLHEAAPGGPLHVAEARARAAHADGILHRHGRAGGARRAGPGARADPRAPQALEAEVDVRRQPAAPGERGHGTGAHALRADRYGHGTPLEQGPQPPEHPRPRGGRPAHPPCVRARAGQRLRQRGLRAGRARDPRVPFGRPDPARCLQGRQGRAPRDRRARLRGGRGRGDPRDAPGRQDHQLRGHLRPDGLRPVAEPEDRPRRGGPVHQDLLRALRGCGPVAEGHHPLGRGEGVRRDAERPPSDRCRPSGARTGRSARRRSAWP